MIMHSSFPGWIVLLRTDNTPHGKHSAESIKKNRYLIEFPVSTIIVVDYDKHKYSCLPIPTLKITHLLSENPLYILNTYVRTYYVQHEDMKHVR